MSMCSLTDFIERSPWSVRRLASTATVTGQGVAQVDPAVRGGDFSWPKTGTSVATSGDFSWPKPGTFSWPWTGSYASVGALAPLVDERIADALVQADVGIVDRRAGKWEGDLFSGAVLALRLQARTQREAWDVTRERIGPLIEPAFRSVENGPDHWTVTIWAVPTGQAPPQFPRQETIIQVQRREGGSSDR